MTTWLSLGCSPTAPQGLERALAEQKIDATITCNAGIDLLERPDFVLIYDTKSCRLFADRYNRLREMGTKLITFHRNIPTMQVWGLSEFDLILQRGTLDIHEMIRQEMPVKGYSGLHASHFAAQRCQKLILVGHDGYAPGQPDHWYEDVCGNWVDAARMEALRNIYQPYWRRLATIFPEVEFVQYGKPHFDVGNSNWSVIEVEP